MLSFPKLLTLVLVVVAVWFGYRWVTRVNEVRQARAREVGGDRPHTPPPASAEDMVKCRTCGTYVPARGAGACGRADCPYGRRPA